MKTEKELKKIKKAILMTAATLDKLRKRIDKIAKRLRKLEETLERGW